MTRRLARFVVVFLVLATVVLVLGRAPAAPSAAAMVDPGGAPAAPSTGQAIDLATYQAPRWVVQLAEPPVAAYTGGIAGLAPTSIAVTGARRLDPAQPSVRAYRQYLLAAQRAFRQTLAKVAPGYRVDQTYTLTVNGLGVKMTPAQAAAVRALPGVKAVTPDLPYQLQMFSTPAQIGAPAVWARLGGKAKAGRGVKVGIIDSGIFVRFDEAGKYAGAPCFRDDGYDLPTGFPKGDARFTNKKVISARVYLRPDDPAVPGAETPLPVQGESAHGTHVAGTVACTADTPATYQGVPVTLDGVAPGAYLMNYKVFYTSRTRDGFQNGNAYVIELVKAIEDAIEDGADVISDSWGSSYQNTLAWPDPMVQAAELAMRSGVVAVFANGNSGPTLGTVIAPAIAPSVIGVGAVTKDAQPSAGDLAVTAPAPVPDPLARMDVGGAAFGPQGLPGFSAVGVVPADTVTSNGQENGCPLADGASPYPADALKGKVALVTSGTCQSSDKVFLAQAAGAVATLVYSGGETYGQLTGQNHAGEVTIPSLALRRSDGLALKEFAVAHPDTAVQYTARPHYAPAPGDVMAGFSSRGPGMDKVLKPDVVAPGVSILSNGFAPAGDDPTTYYTGFGAVSGTSMACPHTAGAAALLVALHPEWTTAQVKAALMATANENVFLDAGKTQRAGLLDRGAGRIDLSKAMAPGVFLDPPSVSFGELRPGATMTVTVRIADAGDGAGQWQVSPESINPPIVPVTPGYRSVTVPEGGATTLPLVARVPDDAALGDYEAVVRLTYADGRTAHAPIWFRVVPPTGAEVLLLDDDRSSVEPKLANYSQVYTATLQSLGLTYRYIDTHKTDIPSAPELSRYPVAVLFTGDNAAMDNGAASTGLSGTERNRLAEWLDGGGRLLATGQNLAEVNGSSAGLSGSRFYKGYLALTLAKGDTFGGPAPRPSAVGIGPFAGLTVDLSPGGDGAGNQASVEATWPITDTDTFAGTAWTQPVFNPLDAQIPANAAIGQARSAEPSLAEPRLGIRYRVITLGFGLEGLNTGATVAGRQEVLGRALDWLLDAPTWALDALPQPARAGEGVRFTARASAATPAEVDTTRWDFGDGSAVVTSANGAVTMSYAYDRPGTYTARLEVTNALGHRYLATTQVVVLPRGLYLPLVRK
jgi:subtilisin family serine protease